MILYILPYSYPFTAIAIWPFIIARKGRVLSERTLRHEKIHHRQQLEVSVTAMAVMLITGFGWWSLLGYTAFYVLYGAEYVIRWLEVGGQAYYDLSFEREAYRNDGNADYLRNRKLFGWIKYLKG